MMVIIFSVPGAPLAWLYIQAVLERAGTLAGDGTEAEFDLEAALRALDYIEDEAILRDAAEALAKAIESPDNPLASQHVANLTRAVARSRLSSLELP